MTEFITWEILSTYAGATAMTTAVVEFFKMITKDKYKIPTQIVSYIIALIVLLTAQLFTGGLTLSNGILNIFNALIVATASNGVYDGFKRITGGK